MSTERKEEKRIVIGFSGFHTEDLTIWAGLLFGELGKKVLLMDFYGEDSQPELLPLPKGYEKIQDTEFEYRGLFYVNADKARIEDFSSEYDIVIASFEHFLSHPDFVNCDSIYLVIGMEVAKIAWLKEQGHEENWHVVIRDYFKFDRMEQMLQEELGYQKEEVIPIPRSEAEYRQSIYNQWNEILNMKNLSYETKEFLLHIAGQAGIDQKQAKAALRAATRRRGA